MARSYNGSSDFSETSSSLGIKGAPFSMACWFNRVDAVANVLTAMSLADSFAGSSFHRLFFFGGNAGGNNNVAVQTQDGATNAIANSTTGIPANGAWGHMAGVWASDASRTAYVNGAGKTTDTTSIPLSNALGVIDIGRNAGNGSTGEFMHGALADCAIWNAALTDMEVQLLAQGVRPGLVRSQNLVGWWDQMKGLSFERNLSPIRRTKGTQILTGTTLGNDAPHIIKLSPLYLRPPLMSVGSAGAFTPLFRKTLSPVGGKIGQRQLQEH